MADTKISGLPASTVPLAGTEVLPIVQSSATKQVSVADLTAGRAISATQLTLTTGNLIVANGQGVDFSATSHPAGMTSELFDDYEEGTWTPVYSPTTNSFTSITAVTSGTYRKIGDVVFFWCDLRTTGTTDIGTASGTLNITGLPFTASGTGYGQVSSMQNWNLGTARTSVSAIVEGGGSLFYFGKINSNSGITYIQATELSIATGNFENLLGVFGMYRT